MYIFYRHSGKSNSEHNNAARQCNCFQARYKECVSIKAEGEQHK